MKGTESLLALLFVFLAGWCIYTLAREIPMYIKNSKVDWLHIGGLSTVLTSVALFFTVGPGKQVF